MKAFCGGHAFFAAQSSYFSTVVSKEAKTSFTAGLIDVNWVLATIRIARTGLRWQTLDNFPISGGAEQSAALFTAHTILWKKFDGAKMSNLNRNDREISVVADKWGGWEKVMSPDLDNLDEILKDFESIGVSSSIILSCRRRAALPPRERAVKEIAQGVYCYPPPVPKIIREREPKRPTFEMRFEIAKTDKRIEEFNITIEEIRAEILSHPHLYSDGCAD